MSSKKSVAWILSCEHGGNQIPASYLPLFDNAEAVLKTHRGWDPGALALFERLKPLAHVSHSSTVSRLLIELNRSLHHSSLFSSYTSSLSQDVKQGLITSYYTPYRQLIQEAIQAYLAKNKQVFHLSIHSFTPVLDGEVRNADIGLLYDPGRKEEKTFCAHWKAQLQQEMPQLVVRYNYPYRGTADGFTTYLRKQFPQDYVGIEVELNQRWAGDTGVYKAIYESLKKTQQTLG